VWGAVLTMLFFALELIAPVYIATMFNKIQDAGGFANQGSLSQHGAGDGIPANQVWESTRPSSSSRVQRQRERLRQHAANLIERQSDEALGHSAALKPPWAMKMATRPNHEYKGLS